MERNDVCVELTYLLDCKCRGVPVFVVPVALSCVRFYCPAMVIDVIDVIVVAVLVNIVTVVVLGAGGAPC